MSNGTKSQGNTWRLLLIGAPFTFLIFFIAGMVIDWRTKPFAANVASSMLDATLSAMVFAVLERLFSFLRFR
jgi:hypothetical protein